MRFGDLVALDREAETSPRRLMILIGVGVALVLLTWWMMSETTEDDPAPPAPAAPVAPPSPMPVPSVAPPIQPGVPAASIDQLQLFGVSGIGEHGAAIVSLGGESQRLVRTGREVVPGVTLVAVAPNHVVLDDHGRPIQLLFPDAEGVSRTSDGGPRSGPGVARADRVEAAVPYLRALEASRSDGRLQGFVLGDGEIPAVLAQAGLRAGDVIVSVGGTRLEGPEDIERIPRELSASDNVRVKILRDGASQTLSIARH